MFLLTGRIPWSLWLVTILSVCLIKDSIAYQDLLTGFNIEYLRTSNYVQCSKWTIEKMRYDVLGNKGAGTLLQEKMKWNIKAAARNYILPEVPIKVIYVFQMQCKLTTGCLDMIYVLPYHEAMQMTSISATNTETGNKLEVTNINPIKMNYNCIEPLDLKNEVIRPRNIPDCTMCYPELYRITMDKAVNNDQVIHIRIEYYLNRPYEPLQKKLARGLQQKVVLPLHTLITVPYHIQVQRTRFTFENDMEFDIHSLHTYANIQKIKHNVLVTKHFEKVEFMSTGETMVLKFNHDETMEYIPKLNKNVYIPLWSLDGNINIQEGYVVYNDASPIEVSSSDTTYQ
uniref:Dolichyl-diphosphooligosaccharide--protein glycosyltransferase subunit 1 n=1 Tax=Babesia bovis TaxID=5865 RepID=A7AMY0_BABBO|eukprot:XP_001611482.1 hypothetical protein [Babesia bovis T2Bo]